ncbi:Protoheme IX farnesyltransferase [Mitosporidium daphniae]
MNVLQINKLIFATHSHLPCNIIKFNTPRKVFFSLNPLSKYTLQSYSTESKLASGNQSNPDCLSSLSPLTEQSPLAKIIPQLFKIKLSAMVLCTTLTGFVIVPGIDLYCWTTIKLLGNTLLGTSLCSFSANAFNQWIEASFDAQMKRTEFRPLPLRRISLPNAFIASSMMGLSGVAYLYYFVSGVSSIIAASTIILYAGVYTPLKRMSIMNTWVGSIVGAFPPLIGCSNAFIWMDPHFFSVILLAVSSFFFTLLGFEKRICPCRISYVLSS